jgi:hypothetical protein
MTNYRPEIREVPAYCFADGLWISGAICVPAQKALVDHLNQGEPFLKLRKVEMTPGGLPFEFLALRRDAVSLVIPGPGAERIEQKAVGSFQEEVISCLLPGGTVSGRMRLLSNLRVSDHLMRSTGFVAIHDCRVQLHASAEDSLQSAPLPVAVVNMHCILGVSESPK